MRMKWVPSQLPETASTLGNEMLASGCCRRQGRVCLKGGSPVNSSGARALPSAEAGTEPTGAKVTAEPPQGRLLHYPYRPPPEPGLNRRAARSEAINTSAGTVLAKECLSVLGSVGWAGLCASWSCVPLCLCEPCLGVTRIRDPPLIKRVLRPQSNQDPPGCL